jgi:phospholipase C
MRKAIALAAAGLAVVSGALAWSVSPAVAAAGRDDTSRPSHVKHLVVIYEENHSFDNLYGGWGSVNGEAVNGIGGPGYDLDATQVDQQGNAIGCLYQNDANLATTSQTFPWIDASTGHPGHQSPACSAALPNPAQTQGGLPVGSTTFDSHFTSSTPFAVNDYVSAGDTSCAPPTASLPNGVLAKTRDAVNGDPQGVAGGCTGDMVHRFYQEQYQLDGGKQDRYSTGSDSAGLTQAHYNTTALPIYAYLHDKHAPNYVVADNFFQGAFGGSFLNHQYLIAAKAPVWVNPPAGKNSALDAAGFPNKTYPLYQPQSGATYNDGPLTQPCPSSTGTDPAGYPVDASGRACGNYAVNTMQPFSPPHAASSNTLPLINDTDPSAANYETNIGDRLSAKGVSWNWYSGGWNDANAGHPDPLFQYHHQPFVNGKRKLTPYRQLKIDPLLVIGPRLWPRGRGRGLGL